MTTVNFGYIRVQAEPRSAAKTSASAPESPAAAKNGVSSLDDPQLGLRQALVDLLNVVRDVGNREREARA